MNPDTFGTGKELSRPAKTDSHRRLPFLRVLWLAMALLIVGILVAAVPARFALLSTVCVDAPGECPGERLTPDTVRALRELGLSVEAYVAYEILLDASIALVALAIGLLIFWQRSVNPRALLIAFLPILGGATFAALPESLEGGGCSLHLFISWASSMRSRS